MNECAEIAALWITLNPHVAVHGCEINPAGSVIIYVLYNRNYKMHPLEINIGNPAKTVLRGLRNAVNAAGRTSRLSSVSGSQIVDDRDLDRKSIDKK